MDIAKLDSGSRLLCILREESQAFARLSGDFNPQHLDALIARRTLFGRTVVHGLHAALLSVDRMLISSVGKLRFQTLTIHFYHPIGTDEEFVMISEKLSDFKYRIKLYCQSKLSIHIDILFDHPQSDDWPSIPNEIFESTRPDIHRADEIPGLTGKCPLRLSERLCCELFPNIWKALPANEIAIILSMTTIVGMRIPGLHSIFKSLSLNFQQSAKHEYCDYVEYALTRYVPSFSFCSISVSAKGATGKIDAIVRPAPMDQPSYEQVRDYTSGSALAGHRLLVVGGSRGIGEVVAKVAAAHGAIVHITFVQGAAEAASVIEQMRAGGVEATASQLDVLLPTDHGLNVLSSFRPTLICYFATPKIALKSAKTFSLPSFNNYFAFYFMSLEALIDKLLNCDAQEITALTVIIPSTIYVDQYESGAAEYAAAKAAAEVALTYKAAASAGKLQVISHRLPRVETDQTATPVHKAGSDIVAVAAKVLGINV